MNLNEIMELNKDNKPIKFVCIGSSRIIIDCFGPFVGTFLQELGMPKYMVEGTLSNDINAKNITKNINNYQDYFVVAIGSCCPKENDDFGDIKYENKTFKPGSAMGNEICELGNCRIVMVTEFNDQMLINIGVIYERAKEVALNIFHYFQLREMRI